LRDILARPVGEQSGAIVFLIQGYSCATVEARTPGATYGELARAFVGHGIAFYRVEKPGVGDSEGPLNCRDLDFATELAAFKAAYFHLGELGYAPSRVFILGHSLGGMEAPLIAAQRSPRGVAVYGTVMRNWADYMFDLDRFQDFAMFGKDPGDLADFGEADRNAIRDFFFDRKPMASIVAKDPARRARLTEMFGWDGATSMFGRSERFMQDLAYINLARAWSGTKSRVLSLYGASDIIALNGQDQKDLVDIVNFYRPGTAEYVEVPDTMHNMDVVGDRTLLRRKTAAAGELVAGRFNPAVATAIIDWIQSSLSKPPVN
jgi:pimeloyl-ACP methyl ester carboxylesterase